MQSLASRTTSARIVSGRTSRACASRPVFGGCQRKAVARETKLNASLMPLMAMTDGPLYDYLKGQADQFAGMDLPQALVQWGHPGNMFVVLSAMGGYGAVYLGWTIRTSDNAEAVAKAKADHPKIALGMTMFFALGALGGMTSLLMQGRNIFDSPHVWSGLAGLGLLAVQATLPAFFSKEGMRDAHAYLGSATMALFVVHAVLGLNLGLSLNAINAMV